jgi:hypothetical protein
MEEKSSIYMLLINIFVLVCNFLILKNLINNNSYNNVFNFYIYLIIISFLTIAVIIFSIINSKSFSFAPLFQPILIFFNLKNNILDLTTIYRNIATLILLLVGFLQFISVILFTIVLNNSPQKTDTFELTPSNAKNYSDYQNMYIFTYICMIILAFIIITPVLDINNKKEVIFYFVVLFLSTVSLIYVCSSCFSSCFAIYQNVVLNGNQLTLQDVPQKKYDPPIELEISPSTLTPTIKPTELPLCNIPTTTPPDGQCSF